MADLLKVAAMLVSVTMQSEALQIVGAAQMDQLAAYPVKSGAGANSQIPQEPGCFVRKLRGCPNHPEYSDSLWRHAMHAEKHKQAKVNRTACEVDVKAAAMEWCGVEVEAIQVAFVAEPLRDGRASSPWRSAKESRPAADQDQGFAADDTMDDPMPSADSSSRVERGLVEPTEVAHNSVNIDARVERAKAENEESDNGFGEGIAREVNHGSKHTTGTEPPFQVVYESSSEPGSSTRTEPAGIMHEGGDSGFAGPPAAGDPGRGAHDGGGDSTDSFEEEEWGAANQLQPTSQANHQGFKNAPEKIGSGGPAQRADVMHEGGDAGFGESAEPFTGMPESRHDEPSWTMQEASNVEVNNEVANRQNDEVVQSPQAEPATIYNPIDEDDVVQTPVTQSRADSVVGAVMNASTDQDVDPPSDPGCYVRTPSGCPNHPNFSSSPWKHDAYAERSTPALLDSTECEVVRKRRVAHWCGIEDVHMLHVAPLQPGCYVRTPQGCPNHPALSSRGWKRDEYGENFTEAKVSRTSCESTRMAHMVQWCGTEFVEMLFVPGPSERDEEFLLSVKGHRSRQEASMDPGCFVRTPNGCPRHPNFGGALWRHDEFGERSTLAKKDQATCEVHRKETLMRLCDTEDVEMMFVPKPKPGCYVRTPSGCPNHPNFGSDAWKHEEYGENHTHARASRNVCQVDRKDSVMRFCGTNDVHMFFVPPDWGSLVSVGVGRIETRSDEPGEAAEVPTEPGCFVRTPTGCPKHPSFNSTKWTHEEFGERSDKAGWNRKTCESERRSKVAQWCGAEDVEMLFVPQIEPGCYTRTPSGCPSDSSFSSAEWKHDEQGEMDTEAATNRSICEIDRKVLLNQFCGSNDTEMLFIPRVHV